jgi:hypothetical protein
MGHNSLTIRTFLFSPPLSAPPPACTANFCVFSFKEEAEAKDKREEEEAAVAAKDDAAKKQREEEAAAAAAQKKRE